MRFGVGTAQRFRRFLDRREIAEGTRNERHIVIDGLGDTDHGQRVVAPLRFLKQFVAAALGTVATDGEQDVHAAPDQVVHGGADVHRPARSAQHGAAVLVNVMDEFGGQHERLSATRRVESLIAVAEAEHVLHAIAVVQLQK